jgi:hypothetical protein
MKKQEFIIELESLIFAGAFKEFQTKLCNAPEEFLPDHDTSFAVKLMEKFVYQKITNDNDFSEEDCIELLRDCRKYGENLNIFVAPESKKTLLMLAVEYGCEKIVDFLISQRNVNLIYQNNCEGNAGMDAIDYSVIYGHSAIFKKLYNKIYIEDQVILSDEKFSKMLEYSILSSDMEIVEFLICDSGVNIDPLLVQEKIMLYEMLEHETINHIKLSVERANMRGQDLTQLRSDLEFLKKNHESRIELFEYLSSPLKCHFEELDFFRLLAADIALLESEYFGC